MRDVGRGPSRAELELGEVTVSGMAVAATGWQTGALLRVEEPAGGTALRLVAKGLGGTADLRVEDGTAPDAAMALTGVTDTFPTLLAAWSAPEEIVVQRIVCARPF